MVLLMSSNLRAIREGIAMIAECEGMGFRNYDPKIDQRFMGDLFCYFPFKHKESLWLNTPTVANIAYAALKPFLSTPDKKANFHLGCKLEGYEEGRIDQLFLMPTPEEAQESAVRRMEGYLKERCYNLKNYRLPKLEDEKVVGAAGEA